MPHQTLHPPDVFERRLASPMLIGADAEPFDSENHLYELKMDGERCLAYLDAGVTHLINRRGVPILAQFPELANIHLHTGARCIVDGELVVGTGTKEDFELIKKRALSRQERTIRRLATEIPCTFVALDLLYLDSALVTQLPLTERKRLLSQTIEEKGALVLARWVEKQGTAFYKQIVRQGMEGIIAKRKDSLYHMGRRTRDWLKIKNWLYDRFVVCGYILRDGSSVASLILGQYDSSGNLAYNGRVAIAKKRDDFQRVIKQPVTRRIPFSEPVPAESRHAVWIQPHLVCTVGFLCWTLDRRLRQPFFLRLNPELEPKAAQGGFSNRK